MAEKMNTLALWILLTLVFALLLSSCHESTKTNTTTGTTTTVESSIGPINKSNPKEEKALSILRKSNCLSCHSIARKVVGPAYYDVADRYRGKPIAKDFLQVKIREGGSGHWGNVAMPPNPEYRISDEDLAYIVDWILALERKKK